MGLEDDEVPTHFGSDIKFENENKFRVPLGFADYLVSMAMEGASGEVLRELRDILDELGEIVLADVLKSENLLQLTLKSENKKISLVFENKYPFGFRTGKIFPI